MKLERDHNVKPQTLVETFHQAYSNSRKIWNGKLILTAGRWRSKQKNPVQKIYIFKQLEKFVTNLLQIHFVTHFLFYFHFSFSPWRRFVFNQEYWAIIWIHLFCCFILLFTSSSSCRKNQFAVSYFSTSLIVLIQVYNWEIQHHALFFFCMWTCWHVIYFGYSNSTPEYLYLSYGFGDLSSAQLSIASAVWRDCKLSCNSPYEQKDVVDIDGIITEFAPLKGTRLELAMAPLVRNTRWVP